MTKEDLKQILFSLAEGFGLSGGTAMIWPEVIHGVAVVITGIISTIAIFFTNRWLHKKYSK